MQILSSTGGDSLHAGAASPSPSSSSSVVKDWVALGTAGVSRCCIAQVGAVGAFLCLFFGMDCSRIVVFVVRVPRFVVLRLGSSPASSSSSFIRFFLLASWRPRPRMVTFSSPNACPPPVALPLAPPVVLSSKLKGIPSAARPATPTVAARAPARVRASLRVTGTS